MKLLLANLGTAVKAVSLCAGTYKSPIAIGHSTGNTETLYVKTLGSEMCLAGYTRASGIISTL